MVATFLRRRSSKPSTTLPIVRVGDLPEENDFFVQEYWVGVPIQLSLSSDLTDPDV
jgi:hypothetical protein